MCLDSLACQSEEVMSKDRNPQKFLSQSSLVQGGDITQSKSVINSQCDH
ncbi:10727_t:CDS:1, partial [Acaulospora colombiana]